MAELAELKELYTKYEQTIEQTGKETSALSRMFNVGVTPRNHPANKEFYDGVARWVTEFLAEDHPYGQLLEATRHILETAAHKPPQKSDAHWYLMAAQAHAKPLIPLLTAEDRAALRDGFCVLYPKRHRMPLQDELLKLLNE